MDRADIWPRVSKKLENILNRQEYETWFKPVKFKMEKTRAVFLVPNHFFRNWIIERYQTILDRTLAEEFGKNLDVEFEIDPDSVFPAAAAEPKDAPLKPIKPKTTLDNRYTFASFVVGSCNELAHSACMAVAEQPGKKYNPLFIFGGAGLGKTHLLTAVGNYILERRPSLKVQYSSSELFTNELIRAIRFGGISSFQDKYRRLDCLLLDDIQFIAGRERTQQEIFYTFNTLLEAGKQMIITSDKKPSDIAGLEKRLWTRFEWGLLTDLQPPDQETKVAILQKKAAEKDLFLSREAAFFLASQPDSNIRVLEGYLNRLSAACELKTEKLTLDVIATVLGPLVGPRKVSLEKVLGTVAEYFEVKVSDMKGSRKTRAISHPRQMAMYMARRLTKASYPEIGRALGGKDHSSIVKGAKKIKNLSILDPGVSQEIRELEKKILETEELQGSGG